MDLYCWQHNTNHRLTAGEVERAFYALGAAEADARMKDAEKPEAGFTPDFTAACPVEVLRWARDPEMYGEHVEQGVECRKRVAGEAGR